MKYAIVGSRKRNDEEIIREFVRNLPCDSIIVSGGCRGVDTWAIDEAEKCGLETIVFLPDLSGCKKRFEFAKAYYSRNQQIAEFCDILVAFVSADRKGGTEDTIKKAARLNRKVMTK